MDALAEMFVDLGHQRVATYIQTGNVVFASRRTDRGALGQELAGGLLDRFGVDSPVLLRSAPEFERLARSHPFDGPGVAPQTLHVTFLADAPDPSLVVGLDPPAAPGERWVVAGADVLLCCPDGYGRTKLTNGYFERHLGQAATTRNWRTVQALAEMCRA
jgi:uncharacterized protein (DUF1697 family)